MKERTFKMIKIDGNKVKIGDNIYLPEAWHENILAKTEKKDIPYQYTIKEEKKLDQKVFICEGIKNKKSYNIALTENVIKYLLGSEVPDSNIGFSFKEYLPVEGTDILITSNKNPSDVVPAKINLYCEYVEIEDKKYVLFDFRADYLNGKGFTSINYYTGYSRGIWKFLFHTDISYMTDYEKMFQDTYVHKEYIKKACRKLADYMFSKGMDIHAKKLLERAETHDNSKVMCEDELYALSTIINDKSCLKDANKALSQLKQDAIKLHWKHNSHHPEHFKNYADMERLDVMEMVCDWYARALQYGTDLMEFAKIRQEDRFHFPQYMFDEIMFYCEILVRD
ncbi:hypothetical protein DW886_16750 [Enterocloster aldenensis]|uniref:DUF5662 family protein n=1 Tax=Enterocloster aldenensis TaxID=358742 RepID=UPI000E48309E|nr:hypothetical protein DW886_16750 [Enterocloster aldenensis]